MKRLGGGSHIASGALVAVLLTALLAGPPSGALSNDPYRRLQYGLDQIQAETAWPRTRGAGVAIAVIDTGIDLQHEDLRDRLIQGRDFVDDDDVPQDENGHGTHVAGVAAATADNGVGIAGVAPGALLMPLRVLDKRGTGTEANVVEAISFALQQSRALNMKLVVNLSLTDLKVSSSENSSRQIQEAVRRAWFQGAVIVAAAGNENIDTTDYPAAGPNVLSVGATDATDTRASFSNRGPLVVAPGEKIVSTYWDPATPDDHTVYASGSGTSMAAPHVSGLAALLLSSGLTNTDTVDRIVRTSIDLGVPGRDAEFGFGRVSAPRALGMEGAPVVTPGSGVSVPLAAEGQFEQVVPLQGAGAPTGPASSGQPSLPLSMLATLLVALAFELTRRFATAEATAASPPSPWEF